MAKRITAPFTLETVKALNAGDSVLLSGVIYTARDAAHLRMQAALKNGESLPFDLKGQVIYYAGPTPTPEGKIVGSIGPTTSKRMDASTPLLLSLGLMGMIGKGERSKEVIDAMVRYPSVYFAALGGGAALMAKCVEAMEVIAYEDLGPESIKRLIVKDLPLTVATDCYGVDYYREGQKEYIKKQYLY